MRLAALLALGLGLGAALAAEEPFPRLPPGFPVPAVPEANPITPAKVELGRWLFYDRRLSADGTQACADCHQQARGFTDGKPRAVGSRGAVHPHGAMSLANVAYNAGFGWSETRDATLEEQLQRPLFGHDPIVEMGAIEAELGPRLASDPELAFLFALAFPARPIDRQTVTEALASFERTLISGRSAFDRWWLGQESDAVGEDVLRGLALFTSDRLGCSNCHTGFTFSAPARWLGHEAPLVLHRPRFVGEPGRPAFRAPTLRNLEVTAPYMHDGRFETLGEVLDHYQAGGSGRPGAGFVLGEGERGDLLAFLRSLTDREFLEDERFGPPTRGGAGVPQAPASRSISR